MKKLFILFAAIAAFASCAKENPSTTTEGQIVTLQALAPARENTEPSAASANLPQTKTQLVDGTNVQWTPGDVVKVCFEPVRGSGHNSSSRYGYSTIFTNPGTELSESATFTGTWQPHSKTNLISSYGVAVYPGNSSNFSFSSDVTTKDWTYPTTTITYTIPTEQEATEGTFAKDLNLSYAMVNYSDVANNNEKVQFKNLCSVFCVTLPSTEYNVKSIKLEVDNNSNNTYMTGLSNFQLTESAFTEKEAASSSKPTYVVLKKADGSDLKPGASYYAVVWAHNYRGVKLTFTNDAGKECVKTAAKDAWIQCAAGKKYNFNISSLSFTTAPYLNVDATSITANAKGGTYSFTVSANNQVTVSTSEAWLSASYANGECTVTAQKNKDSNTRTANITITSASLTKTVTVSQDHVTYRRDGSALNRASDLSDGNMYAVCRHTKEDYYWTNQSELKISYQSSTSLPTSCVFIFKKDDSKWNGVTYGYNSSEKYSYMSAGAWKSAYNDQYLNHSFYFGSTEYYFTMVSGWHEGSPGKKDGIDVDIYRTSTHNDMLDYNGAFSWGNSGNPNYKWVFYKVVEN